MSSLGKTQPSKRIQLALDEFQPISVVRPGVGKIPKQKTPLPNVGEQRINTAYFIAESAQAGTGAPAAVEAVRQNFGVPLRYYLVLHMSGLIDFVNALGRVDITLEAPLGGLPAGTHHLDGAQALVFVRERYSADDFSRMRQGQMLILASFRKAIQPDNWSNLPGAVWALTQVIDTYGYPIPNFRWGTGPGAGLGGDQPAFVGNVW